MLPSHGVAKRWRGLGAEGKGPTGEANDSGALKDHKGKNKGTKKITQYEYQFLLPLTCCDSEVSRLL